MTNTIKAIETRYQGYRFRSRLEARWAVFFDTLGVKYEYEKEGYDCGSVGWYLPDFWLPDLGAWIEIKAGEPTREEYRKAKLLCRQTKESVYCFSGPPWFNIAVLWFWYADDEGVVEQSWWSEDMRAEYNWPDGGYYQGWHTWMMSMRDTPMIGVLVESDDVTAAKCSAMIAAYTAARSARFEHGESGPAR